MAGKYPETPAARIARENAKKRKEKRKKSQKFKVGKALPHDRFAPLPSGKRKKSKLGEGGGAVLSAIKEIKKPKKKPEEEEDETFIDDFGDTDTGSDDYTFIDDFGDTDTGSAFDSSDAAFDYMDTSFKHGGRIKKAKKAKAKSRKPRSRPAIRGRRRELKGS